MKRNIFIKLVVTPAALLTIACTQQLKEKQALENKFAGKWVAQYFIDSLSLSNIQTIPYGFTEISIPPDITKTVAIWNEDVDKDAMKATISTDTLITRWENKEVDKLIIRDNKLLVLPDNVKMQPVQYVRIDSALSKKAAGLQISVVRLLINRLMAAHKYAIGKQITLAQFTEDGRVTEFENFTHYYIAIAGDNANVENATAFDFLDATGKTLHLGMKMNKNTIEFYTLKLLTAPGEKPFYTTDKLWRTLKPTD